MQQFSRYYRTRNHGCITSIITTVYVTLIQFTISTQCSRVTWPGTKLKSTTNKLHTPRMNLSLQYTRGPVISTACIQQQLHSLFPLENKQTGIHSRAMNNRTSKWSSCQRTWTASAAMPNERRDAQAGSFRKLCLTPNKTSKVTFVQFTYIVPTWSY